MIIYIYIHILTLLHTYSYTICIEKVPKANLTQICFSHRQDHIIAKVGGQSRRSTSEWIAFGKCDAWTLFVEAGRLRTETIDSVFR